ncbi:MAG: hypothetical protein U0797_13890 [Gemmataceae bacterium]
MTDPPQPQPDRPRTTRSFRRMASLPTLSGKASAFWLAVCFVLTALLIPMALRLPRWVEAEIVLGVWWAIWFGVLTRMLHVGWRVSDDHALPPPRNWFSGWRGFSESSGSGGWALADGVDDEGCLWALAALLAFVLLLFVAWFLIEIAVPVLLFLLYFVTRGMLARVTKDPHRCQGHLPRSLGWAFVWATLYTAPLALAVWAVHFLHERSKLGG